MVHIIKSTTVATFEEYGKEAFPAFIQRKLAKVKRVDVVWDQYLLFSIKGLKPTLLTLPNFKAPELVVRVVSVVRIQLFQF